MDKAHPHPTPATTKLFLCGDMMPGRGIDQIMGTPSDPRIEEAYMHSALGYVRLAEDAHGALPRRAGDDYVWGDLLADLDAEAPDARIANLETAATTSEEAAPKGINYRMHPANAGCLTAARLDCCTLANNHVLDWGVPGLLETLDTLTARGIATAGAGRTAAEAARPAVLALPERRRILVFALASGSSGVPRDWAAGADRPGVALLPDLSRKTAERVAAAITAERRPGDLVVVSLHWGGNWGYKVPRKQRSFAHTLIDAGACDVLHGHSAHHPKGLEVYKGRLILYGCGDFLNDYEGIRGYEEFRDDLALAWLPELSRQGTLTGLTLLAYRIRRFRLERASAEDTAWLCAVLARESSRFGVGVAVQEDNRLRAEWSTA